VPISLACACGKALRVKDELAGRKVKCPGCQAVLAVPAPGPELLPETDPPPRLCPICKAENPAEQETCLSCGVPMTPPAGPDGAAPSRVYSSRTPSDKELPFVVMVLGMIYRPWFVLDYFRGWAERKSVLVQLGLLYAGSLAAIAGVAAAGYLGPDGTPKAAPVPAEEETVLADDVVWKNSRFEARGSPALPTAGRPIELRVRSTTGGKPAASALSGQVQRKAEERYDVDTDTAVPVAPAGPVEKLEWTREGETAWHRATFTPPREGDYGFRVEAVPPIPGPPAEFEVSVAPALPGIAVAAVGTLGRIVFTILVSILGVAISAGAINVASKVLGEGGEFFFLAVVLVFVESIVNLGTLAMLGIIPLVGADHAFLVRWAFGFWQTALVLLAIMKVYEFDLGAALLTSAIAGMIKIWAAGALVGSVLGAF
jgi:hypothetical protein